MSSIYPQGGAHPDRARDLLSQPLPAAPLQDFRLPFVPRPDAPAYTHNWTITPAIAEVWLTKNKINRHIRPRKLAEYMRDMTANDWRQTGEPLVWDWNGEFRDGQHRLLACIKSGHSFVTAVYFNADPKACEVMNSGAPRLASDQLKMYRDAKNASSVSAGARIMEAISRDVLPNSSSLSTRETLEYFDENPELEISAQKVGKCHHVLQKSIAVALHYLFFEKDPDAADLFFDRLASGAGLEENHPVHRLRERLIKDRGAKAKMKVEEKIVLTIRAWNAMREGREMQTLRGTVRHASTRPEDRRTYPMID